MYLGLSLTLPMTLMCKPVLIPLLKAMLLILLLHITFTTWGCLNEYGINLAGKSNMYMHEELPYFSRTFDKAAAEKFIARYDLKTLPLTSYERRSDVAVHLCHLGRYDEALVILRELYRHYPKEYQIMSNLGTVYELVGKPDSALHILTRTNALHPDGHSGTEWVHLRILEAKLKVMKDPDWLRTHHVLGLNVDKATETDSGEFHERADSVNDVLYQLEERIPFTPVPDPLLASVLNEVAAAIALEHSITEGYILYYMALQYDPADGYGAQQKMRELSELFKKYKVSNVPDAAKLERHFPRLESDPPFQLAGVKATDPAPVSTWYYWLGGAVLLCAAGFFFFKRR